MTTVTCWTCDHEREVDATEVVMPFCDEDCCHEFRVVVEHLAAGGDPEEIDVVPGSRLHLEALKEVETRRRAERIYIRDTREAEYERNRPRRLPPLYPV